MSNVLEEPVSHLMKNRISLLYQEFSGSNSLALYKHLLSTRRNDIEFKLISRDNMNYHKEYILTSKFIITTFTFLKPYDEQIVIQSWHGFPLKAMGLLNKTEQQDKKSISQMIEKNDIILSYSKLYNTVFNACIPTTFENYVITGMPRNDLLFLSKDESKEKLSKLIGIERKQIEKKKIVLYMPTFRTAEFRKEGEDTRDIIKKNLLEPNFTHFIKENEILFIIKLHSWERTKLKDLYTEIPKEILTFVNSTDLEKLFIDFYEILPAVDLLITDYSSVYFDWLLTEKPVVFFIPDVESYGEARDFLLDPLENWMPGPICTRIDQLIYSIEKSLEDSSLYLKERQMIRDTVHFFKDGASCSRVVNLIDQIIDGSLTLPKTKLRLNEDIFTPFSNVSYGYLRNLIAQGKYKEVKELFEKDYVPNQYYHFLALAVSLANLGMKGRALEYAKKAASLNPNDAEVLFNLAELYYMNNQLSQAAEIALRALDKVGNDPFMFDILAATYATTGEVKLKEKFVELALESTSSDNLRKDISQKYGMSEVKRRKPILILGELVNWEILYDFVSKGFDVMVADLQARDNVELTFARSVGAKILSFDEIKNIDSKNLLAVLCFGNLPERSSESPYTMARIIRYLHEFQKASEFFKNNNPRVCSIFAFNSLESVFEDHELNEFFHQRILSADYIIFPTKTFCEYFRSKFPTQNQTRNLTMLVDTFTKTFVAAKFAQNSSKMVLYFPYLSSYDPIPRLVKRRVNFQVDKLKTLSFPTRLTLLNEFRQFSQTFAFGLGPFFQSHMKSQTPHAAKEIFSKVSGNKTTEMYLRTNVIQEILLYLTAGVIPILPNNGNNFYVDLYNRGMALLVDYNCEYIEPSIVESNKIMEMKRNILTNTEYYTTERFMNFLEEIAKNS